MNIIQLQAIDEFSISTVAVARCADGNGTLTPLFFSDHILDIARAKAICAKCALREQCLADALEREEPWGVWGGELLSMRQDRRQQASWRPTTQAAPAARDRQRARCRRGVARRHRPRRARGAHGRGRRLTRPSSPARRDVLHAHPGGVRTVHRWRGHETPRS